MFSQQMAQALLAGADVLKCIHTEIEISFKFIPKILMSKESIHFFGPLCIYMFPSKKGEFSIPDTKKKNLRHSHCQLVIR